MDKVNGLRNGNPPFFYVEDLGNRPYDYSSLDFNLDSAFSSLNLSSPSPDLRRDSCFPLGGGEGFPSFVQGNADLQRLRVQNAVNGQIDFRGAHVYPTAGMQQSGNINIPFLLNKQQTENYLYSQAPTSPVPNRRFFSIDSEGCSVSRYENMCDRPGSIDLPRVPLKYLRGKIMQLAKNHRGYKLFQASLECYPEEEIDMVLNEVLCRIDELMCDQFGTHVFQKLVKVSSQRQMTQIALLFSSTPSLLINICLNPNGTRAVQKFIEYINTQQQICFTMAALCPGAVTLSTNPNGHHVIQHCLKRFSFEDNKYLINEMTAHCFDISTNKSGCCVMQTCVDFSQGKYRKCLIAEIIANAVHLAEDPYGNYVVQHLLDLKMHEVTEDLLRQLEGFYISLSCNKYASNVVQKCLDETEDEHSSRVIMELLRNLHVSRLLVDPYGNYVIQTALKRFKGPILKDLLNLIRPNASSMRNNMYGKKVIDLVQDMQPRRV